MPLPHPLEYHLAPYLRPALDTSVSPMVTLTARYDSQHQNDEGAEAEASVLGVVRSREEAIAMAQMLNRAAVAQARLDRVRHAKRYPWMRQHPCPELSPEIAGAARTKAGRREHGAALSRFSQAHVAWIKAEQAAWQTYAETVAPRVLGRVTDEAVAEYLATRAGLTNCL